MSDDRVTIERWALERLVAHATSYTTGFCLMCPARADARTADHADYCPIAEAQEALRETAAVTLRLTPEQVTAIRDALRDDLIEDWCSECGKERSPGGPDDDLRREDHDPACALWAAHVAVCEVAP